MTNNDILQTALEQSAIDASCSPEDFRKKKNVLVSSAKNPKARRYLELPFVCNLISYGSNIVASIDMKYEKLVRTYIDKYPAEHCFETPNLHVLNDAFAPHGMRVCFMAEYFLPDVTLFTGGESRGYAFRMEKTSGHELRVPGTAYELRLLESRDFQNLYLPQWSNALCEKRKELDVLGVGAYYGDQLIGLAACSADCETMWQIGIDVLPEFRRQGIASALTGRLAWEILARGKVPFYCCAWSNIGSARNAIRSGFRPAWVELTVKPKEFVDELNNG